MGGGITRKKKGGEEEAIPPVPEGWARCRAYLPKKHRYCRQMPLPDQVYCGNHRDLIASGDYTTSSSEGRKRIPCPLDPSHTIYEDTLARHLKVCPKARLQREQEEQPYYRANVNGGGHGVLDAPKCTPCHPVRSPLERAQAVARGILVVHQRLFGGKQDAWKELSLAEIESALPLKDLSEPELKAGLAEAIESYHIRSGGPKHLQQQASLLGHLRNLTTNSQTSTTSTRMLELGAGRGMLGLVAAGSFAATDASAVDLIMIERAGTRSKADTILRNHKSTLPDRCLNIEEVRAWQRIQCDLAHVDMPTVLSTSTQNKNTGHEKDDNKPATLAIAKHLCGAGTDLALKALYPVRHQIQACMMATCCHGVCSWEHYVGRDYLVELLTLGEEPVLDSFGTEEFELLRLWSSGTVKVTTNDKTDNNNTTTSSPKQKRTKTGDDDDEEETHYVPDSTNPRAISVTNVVASMDLRCGVQGLGRVCQRLLDYGRKQYMQQILFAPENSAAATTEKAPTVELCYYVPSSVTPQNAVLMASRNGMV